MHFADRLKQAIDEKGSPVCVGLDPVLERLPAELTDSLPKIEAIEAFCNGVVDAVAEHVPCIKPQSACFERYHSEGVAVYDRVVDRARKLGLIVIGDAKRGDIGISSAHYAAGCLLDDSETGLLGPDALTVNAYLGVDGLQPFIDAAAEHGKGLFALVRTSNPGGDAIQGQRLADGRTVAEMVADIIAETGAAHVGDAGYSLLGAVVGATKSEDAVSLRQRMPQQVFLVPGFGAQGAGADDVRACFNRDGQDGPKAGYGAIITASRSVIYAYANDAHAGKPWQAAVADAAKEMAEQVRTIVNG